MGRIPRPGITKYGKVKKYIFDNFELTGAQVRSLADRQFMVIEDMLAEDDEDMDANTERILDGIYKNTEKNISLTRAQRDFVKDGIDNFGVR